MAKEEKEKKVKGWGAVLKDALKEEGRGFRKAGLKETNAWGKAIKHTAMSPKKKKR